MKTEAFLERRNLLFLAVSLKSIEISCCSRNQFCPSVTSRPLFSVRNIPGGSFLMRNRICAHAHIKTSLSYSKSDSSLGNFQCFIVTPSLPSKTEKGELRARNIRTLEQLHHTDWNDSLVSSLKQIISCHNVF